jgi:DNA-binding response OmpR family regulator
MRPVRRQYVRPVPPGRPVWRCRHSVRRVGAGQHEASVARPRSTSARRVLVVDDDAAIRLLCRFNLAAAGINVLEASDGEEGLAALGAGEIDLVLLDVMMPGRDGWQVAAAPEAARVPIVFLTARAEEADREHAYALGAVGYIVKPFDPVDLASRLDEIFRRLERGERDALRREVLSGET